MTTLMTLPTLRDRVPTAAERDVLAQYAATIRDRQAAVEEVETVGDAIVEDVMARMKQNYPNIPRYHAQGFDKGYRDNRILLSYLAKMMYLNDQQLLDDQILNWIRTLFKSFNFTPKFMRDNFTLLREATRKRVTPRSFAMMEPFLDHTIDYLSDIPEPARAEV